MKLKDMKRYGVYLIALLVVVLLLTNVKSCEDSNAQVLAVAMVNDAILSEQGTASEIIENEKLVTQLKADAKSNSIIKASGIFFLVVLLVLLATSLGIYLFSYVDWIKEKSVSVIAAMLLGSFILASFIFSSTVVASESQSLKTSKVGVNCIKSFEGYRAKAYRDAVGVWTIGWGTITNVKKGMQISRAEATYNLRKDLWRFEKYVNRKAKRNLTQNEFDALVSFSYNLGYRLKGRLLAWVNNNSSGKVVWLMNKYVNAGGKPLRGLIRRRRAEGQIYKGFCPTLKKYNRNYCC